MAAMLPPESRERSSAAYFSAGYSSLRGYQQLKAPMMAEAVNSETMLAETSNFFAGSSSMFSRMFLAARLYLYWKEGSPFSPSRTLRYYPFSV